MESLVEHLEYLLSDFISLLKLVLEAIATLTILVGLVNTTRLVVSIYRQRRRHKIDKHLAFVRVRLTFGSWLALALEFQLGADILATTISPSFQALGQLGAIALIRTFLNYFLNQELENEFEYQEQARDYDTT